MLLPSLEGHWSAVRRDRSDDSDATTRNRLISGCAESKAGPAVATMGWLELAGQFVPHLLSVPAPLSVINAAWPIVGPFVPVP